MAQHRFRHLVEEQFRIPSPPPAQIQPGSFVVCPMVLMQGLTLGQQLCQMAIYQLAFEQAQADLRPSWPERDLLGIWN